MDSGEYSSAIECFTKAATDPKSNQKAQAFIGQARRGQETEEKLLKNRH